MRTNIDIKDELMNEAIRLSESKTKKEAVERALEFYIRMLKQRRILELRGNVQWNGNLDEMGSM